MRTLQVLVGNLCLSSVGVHGNTFVLWYITVHAMIVLVAIYSRQVRNSIFQTSWPISACCISPIAFMKHDIIWVSSNSCHRICGTVLLKGITGLTITERAAGNRRADHFLVLRPSVMFQEINFLGNTNCVVIGNVKIITFFKASHETSNEASRLLQAHLDQYAEWLQQWRIRVNETKSMQITFTLKQGTCPPVLLNETHIPQSGTIKYLGLHLDMAYTYLRQEKTTGH
jgi:hypothetical protein